MGNLHRIVRSLLWIGFALSFASSALAEESPVWGGFELKGGGFLPGVDKEPGLTGTPFADVYGESNDFLFMAEGNLKLFRGWFGNIGLFGGIGFFSIDGQSIDVETGEQPGDTTTFEILPLQAGVVYHLDTFARYWNVPFVPFVKYGADYWAWWILDASNDLSRVDGDKAQGATWGTHTSLGLKFLLDWIDPSSAQTFDLELGVNNSYLMVEYMQAKVDDFGAADSFTLGGDSWLFGIAFEM